jgi:hypothetical protein
MAELLAEHLHHALLGSPFDLADGGHAQFLESCKAPKDLTVQLLVTQASNCWLPVRPIAGLSSG